MHYDSLDAFVQALPAMAAEEQAKLRGHDGLLRLDTRQGRTFFVRLDDGVLTLPETAEDTPDCTVTADENDLLQVINGTLSPVKALLFGKIKITGDTGKLMDLIKLVK